MKESKLIKLIQSFSKKEIKEFEKFLNSPFFTSSLKVSQNALIILFGIIKQNYPSFENRNFTKEKVYLRIYPGIKYQDERMRVLMSAMLRLAEEFLIYTEFKQDSFENKKFLLSALIKRKNDKLFEHHEKEAVKLADSSPAGAFYYFRKFILSSINHKYNSSRKVLLKEDNFQEMEDNFFYFSLGKSMDIHNLLLNEKKVFNKDFKLSFYDEILNHIKKNNYDDKPSLSLLINKLLLGVTEDEIYYRKLKELKEKYKNNMDPQLRYDIHVELTNYCIKRMKKGDKEFRKEEFILNKDFVLDKVFSINEFILDVVFLNIVSNASNLKEYGWTENFIEKYGSYLQPQSREETVNFSKAVVNFRKGSYGTALENLSKIQTEHSHLKLSVKNFLLLIYYETRAYEPAFSLIDSYRHFLSGDTSIPEYIKKTHSNFLKFYNELLKFKANGDTLDRAEFKSKLSAANYCAHKDWLLDKAEKI